MAEGTIRGDPPQTYLRPDRGLHILPRVGWVAAGKSAEQLYESKGDGGASLRHRADTYWRSRTTHAARSSASESRILTSGASASIGGADLAARIQHRPRRRRSCDVRSPEPTSAAPSMWA